MMGRSSSSQGHECKADARRPLAQTVLEPATRLSAVRARWFLTLIVAGLAIFAAACSADGQSAEGDTAEESNLFVPSDDDPTTSVDAAAEPTTTAAPTTAPPSTELSEDAVDPASLAPVVYSADIQPILERSCASCHTAEQAGASGVTLASAAQASEFATAIELYTAARLMPPWPASHLSLDFADDVTLSELEIATIARWVSDGAELDVDPTTPIEPARAPSFLVEPEVDMVAVNAPYAGDPEVKDDYRCLIFDPAVSESEWILATHFVPDRQDVVHHGIIKLASAELRELAEDLDAATPEPGWSCYGGVGLEGRGGSLRDLAGWAPGTQPDRLPEGYAVPLDPGDFVVVQVHYHYEGEAPADSSRYQLDLASDEEIAAAGGSFKTLTDELYLGPAEIPCYEGDPEPLCDRDLARERVRSLYGPGVGAFADAFLQQCGARPQDFAAMTNGDAWSTCDLPVSNPGRITSVLAHMHELGSSIRLTLNPDTPEERILLDIPDWDFDWQFNYRPTEEIIIDTGDTIRIDCAWNRERAPYEAVGYILWSDGTGDEMCYSSITTAPVN